jgi:hypothetical protein
LLVTDSRRRPPLQKWCWYFFFLVGFVLPVI